MYLKYAEILVLHFYKGIVVHESMKLGDNTPE